MIQTIDFYDFRDAFKRYGRGDHFSHEALILLFDYIEQYEQDTGVQQEFDPVGICCEWEENIPENIAEAYDIEVNFENMEELEQKVIDYLNDHTLYAGKTAHGTFVFIQF
jgi:hypothetical protein